MKTPQYLKDFERSQFKLNPGFDKSLKIFEAIDKKSEACLKVETHDQYADCMMNYMDKFEQEEIKFKISHLYLMKQMQECYKRNAEDREYDACDNKAALQMINIYDRFQANII